MLKGLGWRVGSGSIIPIKDTSWIPGPPNLSKDPNLWDLPHIHTVANLINQDTKQWDFTLLHRIWQQDIVSLIKAVHSNHNRESDIPIWRAGISGIYSVSLAYNVLIDREHLDSNNLWRSLWKMPCPQKIRFFIWKAIQEGLTTADIIHSRLGTPLHECVLCGNEPETGHHLFSECSFTKALWFAANGRYLERTAIYTDIKQWWVQRLEESSEIPTQAAFWANLCWTVCMARNGMIFKGIRPCIHLSLCHLLSLQEESVKLSNKKKVNHQMEEIVVGWTLPRGVNSKINVDGAARGTLGRAACGVVCRGSDGQFLAAIAHDLGNSTALVAEAQGLLEGLKLALARKERRVEVECDSSVIVGFLNEDSPIFPWSIANIIAEAKSLVDLFDFIPFSHIFREANRTADALANFAIDGFPCIWVNSPPPSHTPILCADVMGGTSVRTVNMFP